LGGPIGAHPWEQRGEVLDGAALVVNTTSQGMVGQGVLDIDLARLPKTAIAADIVYIPLETPFLAAARAATRRSAVWACCSTRGRSPGKPGSGSSPK
jgi:shikimate dehydrogenase